MELNATIKQEYGLENKETSCKNVGIKHVSPDMCTNNNIIHIT